MQLTQMEARILAVMYVCGKVNRQEFNAACNTDGLHKASRERAIETLLEKGLLDMMEMNNARL